MINPFLCICPVSRLNAPTKAFHCAYGPGSNYCNYVFLIPTENCADPGSPSNGFRRGRDFKHERKVTFVCRAGFMLNGANSITCNDGAWSNELPFCTGKDAHERFSESVSVIGFPSYCPITLQQSQQSFLKTLRRSQAQTFVNFISLPWLKTQRRIL